MSCGLPPRDGLLGVLFVQADAGEVKACGVVELFTSQGCSSCPPASSLGELAKQGDVIALAYHVDYWDYLGWQDTLATPDNTARQYDYAKSFGARSVYTPAAAATTVATTCSAKDRSRAAPYLRRLAVSRKRGKGLTVGLKVMRAGDFGVIDAGEGNDQQKGQMVGDYDPAEASDHPAW